MTTDPKNGCPEVLCAFFNHGQGVGPNIMIFLVNESLNAESQEFAMPVFADLIVMR